MTNPFIPKFIKNLFPNSVPWQEAFFHTLLHKGRNNAETVQSQEPTVIQRKWTAQDYKNYEDYLNQQQELEMAYQAAQLERKLASMKAEHERAEKRKELKAQLRAVSEENALRRYKEAFEHASKYGEIISFEYDDKKGSSTVVYRTDDE